jgi:alcohol dehydrogenase class IV
VLSAVGTAQLEVAVHDGLPSPSSVAAQAGTVLRVKPDVIVAVGGGGVLDSAKCAAALAGQHGTRYAPDADQVRQACTSTLDGRAVPLVAVPTTPGTGAEVTPQATIWDRARGRKLSLRGSAVLPGAILLDPSLLVGLSPAQLVSSVLDTLAQATEAMWSVQASPGTESLGAAALRHCAGTLRRIPGRLGPHDRAALLLAGHFSGQAIATAGTTLCHALSYPLTLRYGLTHGHACGLTLGRVLEFNAGVTVRDCTDPRGPERVRSAIAAALQALGVGGAPEALDLIRVLMVAGGLDWNMDLSADVDALAADALSYDRAGNNPRRPDRREAARILLAATGSRLN